MDKNPPHASMLFVAGYADLTADEFAVHYRPRLDASLAETPQNPVLFVLQDAPGAGAMTARYLRGKARHVHVYRSRGASSDGSRTATAETDDSAFAGCTAVDVAGGPAARDDAVLALVRERKACTLIWLRAADEFQGLSAGDVLRSRFSGPRELVRRLKTPGIEQAMAMFDKLA